MEENVEKKEIEGRREWAEEVIKEYKNEIKELEESIKVKKKRIEEVRAFLQQTTEKLQNLKTCREIIQLKRNLNKTCPRFYLYAETKKAELELEKEKIIRELHTIIKEYEDEINSNNEKIERIKNNIKKEIDAILYDEKELIRVINYESVSDDIEPRLKKNYVEVYSNYSGDGGFSKRYAERWFSIIDASILNDKPAYLFEVGVATYYNYRIRGVKKKRYLVGWDDGEVFLTQVYSTANTIQEAVERLIPSNVKKAQVAGKKTIRWGDIWFIETEKKPEKETYEIAIRGNHLIKGWREGKRIYAVKALKHDHHPAPNLAGAVWEVARNRMVSRSMSYD